MGDKILLKAFLLAYIVSTAFTDVLALPGIASKIQLSELIFIPLFGVWMFQIIRVKKFLNPPIHSLEWAILFYIFFAMISSLISGKQSSWLEVAGLIYLAVVYLIFKTSLNLFIHPTNFIVGAFIACGIIAGIAGIAGWVLSILDFDTSLAMPPDHPYPYVGPVPRATGWMVSPNMLFNLISVVILIYFPLFLENRKKKIYHYVLLAVLFAGALLTFSKSILLLLIGILLILFGNNMTSKKVKTALTVICSVLFIVFLAGTHVLVRTESREDWIYKREKSYTAARPFLEWKGFEFYQTNYTINKSAALRAGLEYPLHGVGPGQFNDYVGKLKERGKYPDHFINFDPHSTYLGAFAEGGLPLFFIVIFIVWQIVLLVRKQKHSEEEHNALASGVTFALLFMGMEAISMDVLNFRHLWILLAVLMTLPYLQKKNDVGQLLADQPDHIKSIGENQ